jgi:hypothetical protein
MGTQTDTNKVFPGKLLVSLVPTNNETSSEPNEGGFFDIGPFSTRGRE